MKEFIDSTIFMGMHNKDETIRIACKNFFVKRIKKKIYMSLEQVGKCDDIIWKFDRRTQDAYYPFMDNLHTIMNIKRVSYNEKDIKHSMSIKEDKLSFSEKLTLGMTIARKGRLITLKKSLLNLRNKNIIYLKIDEKELSFPEELEKLYQESLKIRIN